MIVTAVLNPTAVSPGVPSPRILSSNFSYLNGSSFLNNKKLTLIFMGFFLKVIIKIKEKL